MSSDGDFTTLTRASSVLRRGLRATTKSWCPSVQKRLKSSTKSIDCQTNGSARSRQIGSGRCGRDRRVGVIVPSSEPGWGSQKRVIWIAEIHEEGCVAEPGT